MNILAFDLGASSGRALLGRLVDGKLTVEEIHRFPNDPVQAGETLYWDILRLLHEIKQGLLKAHQLGYKPESMAIDSWAVDFGLVGPNGELLGNPVHYRDRRTEGLMEEVFQTVPQSEVFGRTGIQFLPFNTLYQLFALKKEASVSLREADSFLMIPDLLRYFLTGERKNEFSNATTTQFYNPTKNAWDNGLLEQLGIPHHLLKEIVMPGTIVGKLQPSVCKELGIPSIPVVAVAEHDTGSAVAAVPSVDKDFAYLSCGTWSLLGTEVAEPVLTEEALAMNFTNEGGVDGTYRLLKNIMGLWIVQECRRAWEKTGHSYKFEELVEEANQAPAFRSFIDPDDPVFMPPGDMPMRIQDYCRATGQPIPESPGAIIRCVLESLALKYKYVLACTEQLSGKSFKGLHMVGGGINNKLLCQFTANALGRPVWAGPVEGSAIGNLLVQYIALGAIQNIWEARSIVRDSFPLDVYEPEAAEAWSAAYTRWSNLLKLQ
ncbi:rhamnulokinase [Paenibacillus nanensis]|uniref:Rhamnulokinase n=1 Tax=Paenibacillus nanensis TaxID=393251 RepID=A0A3A1UN79_9BACL|nr:rhamnulokinase [Paenibacillus nanensis]RIX50008.1 rhamnulokinase [Paenibacillus nanensis]